MAETREPKRIRCDECGYECDESDKPDALNRYHVGGQHVCDRFQAGIFRRIEPSTRSPEGQEP